MRLIDADALKKIIDDRVAQYGAVYPTDMLNMWGLFKHIIDNASTVEGLQAEWIKGREISRTMIGDEVLQIDYKDYTCSNCGLVLDNLLYNYDGSPFYKFCPRCGIQMRVKDELGDREC